MNLVGLDLEDFDSLDDQGGQQAGAVGRKEPVQSPPQNVVAQVLGRLASRIKTPSPSFDAIERVGPEQNALDQQLQGRDIMGMGDLGLEELAQAQSLQEMVDQRKSSLRFFS